MSMAQAQAQGVQEEVEEETGGPIPISKLEVRSNGAWKRDLIPPSNSASVPRISRNLLKQGTC